MNLNGYRYWVERHKLLVELAKKKDEVDTLPEADRLERTLAVEADFRARLDALYAKVQGEFEPARAKA